jgi:pyridoxine 4-dehydrogenase
MADLSIRDTMRSASRPSRRRCSGDWPRGVQNAILTSPVLADLGARLEATPAQIALAWLLDLAPNVLLIPGTRTRRHLEENIHSASIKLDEEARAQLTQHFPIVQTR